MVYHEVRTIKKRKLNYLIHNKRENGKWIKKSKFIGAGNFKKSEIEKLKKEFELSLKLNKKYQHLNEIQIKEIEELKETYSKSLKGLSEEEFEEFEKSFFTELTYNSNAIEGNSLSLEETSLVINENLVPEGKTIREIYEARNYKLALDFLKKYTGNLNESLILKVHSIILKDISGRFAGKYRKSQVRIFGSDVKFPGSEKVPQLVKNLVYWYNKNKKRYHQFELAILISMKLVTIHPFVDGNGRLSRLIMNFLLRKKDYPPINIYNKQRARYLKAVRKANDEDYTFIFPFLLETMKENFKQFNIV